MLPKQKVDELVAWINEWANDDVPGPLMATLRDKIDDALNDAYGSGEKDEREAIVAHARKAQLRFIGRVGEDRQSGLMMAAVSGLLDSIESGEHTHSDPEHQALLARLRRQTGQDK